MKLFSILAGLSLGLASCTATMNPAVESAPRTVFRNVTVVPMDRAGSVPRQDVLVSAGRIVSVARTGSIRARASDQVIDGSGKYLIPGLWDSHVHALTRADNRSYEDYARWFVANGVTALRDTGSSLDELLDVRRDLEERRVIGPLIRGSGPILEGPRPWHNIRFARR
jgi:imidazolonepropionase-like amidohydrolase